MAKKRTFVDDAGMTWDVETTRELKDGKIVDTEVQEQRGTGNTYTVTKVNGEVVSRKGN